MPRQDRRAQRDRAGGIDELTMVRGRRPDEGERSRSTIESETRPMRPVPHDDYERSVLANIREHDWHCTSVGGDETTPTFTYSVGLHEKLGHPELILIGLAPRLAHAVLSIVVRAAQHGHPFDPDEPCDELLEGYSCLFLDVPPGHYEDWVRSACWYYGGEPFPLLQVVWPSLDGHYPWHEDADDELRFAQPLLAPHASAS